MSFRIIGLEASRFAPLFGLSPEALARHGARRVVADSKPGFPDRIELRDAEPGAAMLLLNYVHQPAETPYRASHAVFVREGAAQTYDQVDEVPQVLRIRLLSVRAFDGAGEMLDADVVDGTVLEASVERMLADPRVDYLHAHYAKRGCYAARIERAPAA